MDSSDPAPAGQAHCRGLRANSEQTSHAREATARAAALYRDACHVAVLHPGEQSRALSRRLRFLALNLMVEARGGC
jgi:hypothetical protein